MSSLLCDITNFDTEGRNYGLPQEMIDAMGTVFHNHADVLKVILYGSRAKGTFRAGSDIDLTMVAPEGTTKTLNRIMTELDDLLLPYEIDLSLYHQIDNQDLLQHIQRVGKVIYTK